MATKKKSHHTAGGVFKVASKNAAYKKAKTAAKKAAAKAAKAWKDAVRKAKHHTKGKKKTTRRK